MSLNAPEVVCNYNKFMGGVDKHDKLRSTFALGKHHKWKKYYVKLMLFLIDIALTNSWIYYKLVNKDCTKKKKQELSFSYHWQKSLYAEMSIGLQSTKLPDIHNMQ